MFARAASVFVLALPLLATATVLPRTDSQCNSGSTMCCNSTQSSTSSLATILAGLLGIGSLLGGVTSVGITCSPVVGILSGSTCSQQAACCTGNTFSGLITLGCNNISL